MDGDGDGGAVYEREVIMTASHFDGNESSRREQGNYETKETFSP
jgi:hypothetical protein